LTTLLAIMKYMSRPKSTAVKDIDIANILGQKYRFRNDIDKDDIDPPLIWTQTQLDPWSVKVKVSKNSRRLLRLGRMPPKYGVDSVHPHDGYDD